jgi:ATP-dependent DNA helicase DinG
MASMIDARTGGRPERDVVPRFVFAHLWTTGPDTSHDRPVRLLAMKQGEGGAWLVFDSFVATGDEGGTSARLVHELGVTSADLAGAALLEAAWPDYRAFLGEGPVISLDGAAFRRWYEHLAARAGSAPEVVGLDEVAALLLPGRLANLRDELIHVLLARPAAHARAIFPVEIASALAELVSRFLALEPRARALARWAWEKAREGLAESDPAAARRLELALAIVSRPSSWSSATGGLLRSAGALHDDGLPGLGAETPAELCATSEPRCARLGRDWSGVEPLAITVDPRPAFAERDKALLDDLFRVHLPRLFAEQSVRDPRELYRASQHEVAIEVAGTLGADELLLVHAPTGTGKTLAYLLPALLWARRNGLRVGVATYTRALQEQAMEREVPIALRALASAGEPSGFRVAVLKGRENYLCWRSFLLALPEEDDAPESFLGWASLLLFALGDGEGDLDRFPLRSAIGLASETSYRRALEGLVRGVRARQGCCTHAQDRLTCAAELARRRAERSHVVLTNHAFALTRREFFRHIVFDECEHLHDQALNAWSHRLSLRAARGVLAGLHRPRNESSRAPLDRLARALLEGTPSHGHVSAALEVWERCYAALEQLGDAALEFEHWREEAQAGRHERERHALLREYVESAASAGLVDARLAASAAVNALDVALAELSERLESMPLRGRAEIRRSLDRSRGELADLAAVLESWLPVSEGRPALRQETFYDVEVDGAGEIVLCARVLLPNEYLGRAYHPLLASGVFLSATTYLRGSFDGALGYLGLDRAATPAPTEERQGRAVRTFRGPEVFDYSRVLVAVPRDAPPVAASKQAYLAYVRRFLAWLGERTRGRILTLFTNQQDVLSVGRDLGGFFRARQIPLWWQGMEGTGKEELSDLFRSHVDSILLGVDTFWYGADFPGETLEYLVIVRLPYGVPDRYHHAQCAALGQDDQRRRIYLPRALAKFRQGFGRLMRKQSDRGVVFVLDQRILDPRHRAFLTELPIAATHDASGPERKARLVRADTDRCLHDALAHMGLLADVRRRGLSPSFEEGATPPRIELPLEDLPF